jgi:hypothetical protein
MSIYKEGDKVLVTKRISDIKNVKALVIYVSIKNEFYRVRHNYNRDGYKNNTCNIFYNHSSESIELDLEEIRNDKLKTLGI